MQDTAAANITAQARPLSFEKIVSFKDPRILWDEHWFALLFEIASAAAVFQLFRHAKKRGNESFYLLLAALCSAASLEILPILPRPGYQLWWYHQGLLNILHQRVPSFIISSFALTHFVAHNLTKKSNLPALTNSFVTATFAMLLYFPCVWLAPRLLLMFYHHDDPIFKHRLLDVPYIQILVIFLLFFHTSHLFAQNYEAIEAQDRNEYNFAWCSVQSGIVSAIYAIVEQFVLYILLHLTMNMNAGFCVLAALVILTLLSKGEMKTLQVKSYKMTGAFEPLKNKSLWAAVAIFIFTSTIPLWLETQNLRSNGKRLELGSCHTMHDVANTSPLDITRSRFICSEDTPRLPFDFHCIEKASLLNGMEKNVEEYTICGKSIYQPLQVAKHIAIYSALCLFLFYNFMRLSFNFENTKKISNGNIKLKE